MNDAEAPSITCNANITTNNDNGVCGAAVSYTVTSTDNCPGQTIAQTSGLASGSTFPDRHHHEYLYGNRRIQAIQQRAALQ
ncbi:MAG: HYR domain-containing protein [Bacteroidetes bacterium]|nr:HYR domain-containing protein [Bacteroidota bacterium]